MIRYRLDDLGWYQFEWLSQSLLKAELGLGVESWGGHRDHGRDAYTAARLKFPNNASLSEGPFVFQSKFVENANAAGAKNDRALLGAVSKEADRILERRRLLRNSDNVRHYTLLTNALLDPDLRNRIQDIILKVLPNAEIHLLGGGDICDVLDRHPTMRRSFPQLLSIRDLDELLSEVVNREAIEKSKTAIEIAKEVAQVFVPTRAYHFAWETLRDYHFVVLEGPPEVGKTAIAWMVALGQALNGWQVIVCDDPGDFFGSLREGERQIFVSDDAFGRTEYDPARGRKWESQLERVLKRVDANHWFVWTTRKHIFERAFRDLDFQGATQFRKAGKLVDAGQLVLKDKALILYRHAKAAGLSEDAKRLLRQNLEAVIHAPEFTPERIRRFVHDRLPELTSAFNRNQLKPEDVTREVREAIRNPTDRMRKTFQRLSSDHKWVLISLFETGRRAEVQAVEQIYRIRMPEGNEPFSTILDELREAFVTVREPYIDWIHPSYRDLVIEELAADNTLRQKVLTSITLSGLTVAVSDTSGAHGEQKYPLIASPMDWNLLGEGCVKLVFSSSSIIAIDALRVLASAAESATEPEVADELSRLIYKACEAVRERWDANGIVFTADQLRTFCQSSLLASPLPVLPRFEHTWAALEKDLITSLSLWEVDKRVDSDIVQEWAELAQIVAHNEPRFMLKKRFPSKYRDAANRIAIIIDSELDRTEEFDCADDYVFEANRCDRLVKALESLHELDLIDSNIASSLQERLEARSFEYGERASEMGPPEHDYDDYRSEREESINLNEFFRDL